jgi:hypothetical protein
MGGFARDLVICSGGSVVVSQMFGVVVGGVTGVEPFS